MLASKIISRVSKTRCRCNHLPVSSSSIYYFHTQRILPALSDQLFNLTDTYKNKPSWSLLRHIFSTDPRLLYFRQFSTASTESSENGEANPDATINPESEEPNKGENLSETSTEADLDAESQPQSPKRPRKTAKKIESSDSDSELDEDPSKDDLAKLLKEKDEKLVTLRKEMGAMQSKFVRAYKEVEGAMDRTNLEAQKSVKFANQAFAKSLLDVADNLGRASAHVKEKFTKDDTADDSSAAVHLLRTLLEGVEMTEKQLLEVFRKFGVKKFDPSGEPFDPHRHNAIFQLNDTSKPPGTVAVVLKVGYMLDDRVIRPADVGVTKNSDEENSPE